MKLFIGTGADGLKPDGYLTVDIDPANKPDIVADASGLPMIESGSVEEVYVSHVLEHIAWPYALSALAEWSRVIRIGGTLKVAVPDMSIYGEMLARKENVWHVMAMVYGGHWATPGGPQGHHYGYTWEMLIEIMTVLGYADLEHWNSDTLEAANGWLFGDNGERLGVSINIVGTKRSEPLVDIAALTVLTRSHLITEPLMKVVREMLDRDGGDLPEIEKNNAHLAQHLHIKLVDARRREIALLKRIKELESKGRGRPSLPWRR